MSVRVIAMVFEAGPEDLAQHSVMMALADNADDLGVAWPGQELLARKSRQCIRNVRRVLDELAREGWLVEHKRRHGEHRRGSVYELNLARLQPEQKPVADRVSGRTRKVKAKTAIYGASPDTMSGQEWLPSRELRDRTITHRDRTMTPPRPDMALADLLLADGVAFQNRHRTTNEPKDSPLPPARGGGTAYASGPLRGEGNGADAAREGESELRGEAQSESKSNGHGARNENAQDLRDPEALAELDEVNAMRARRTPPLPPLAWAQWAPVRMCDTRATGTETPGRARRRLRRAARSG